MRPLTGAEKRAYDRGYADGYRGAHGLLQREIREEYEERRREELRRGVKFLAREMRKVKR